MPCYTSPDEEAYYRKKAGDVSDAKLKAMLCAVLTSLDRRNIGAENVIDHIDEAESGITKEELHEWWEKHKKEDKERKGF